MEELPPPELLNDSQIDTLLAALEFPLVGGLQPYNPGDIQHYLDQLAKDEAKYKYSKR